MILPHLEKLNQLRIVLASGSPRRRELLELLRLQFTIQVSQFDENLDKAQFQADLSQYPLATATAKAEDVLNTLRHTAAHLPDILVSCDTVVVHQGRIVEKAADESEAAAMIRAFSGEEHAVHTALVLHFRRRAATASNDDGSSEYQMKTLISTTHVKFASLTDEMIAEYVKVPSAWKGKAGAYGIQDLAASMIEGIRGDYYTVMGLPVQGLCRLLVEAIQDGTLVL